MYGAGKRGASAGVHRAEKLPPVAGAMKTSQVAERLQAMGDKRTAVRLKLKIKARGRDVKFAAFAWPWDNKVPAWKYTAHAFGYIPKGGGGNIDITDAGNIQADDSLKGANIKITLDRLRVFDYPGDGLHTVLFDFYAQHQTTVAGESQDLHFNQNYRVQEGAGAGITGYPVFAGLRVGNEGVSFKCYTVNVGNDGDKKILSFLDGDVFKKGLALVNTINPVIPVVSGFATGIIKAFATRNDNVPVQDFYMGLDFSGIPTRAQLREGAYIAVQVPDAAKWNWADWMFKPTVGQIVSKQNPSETIPFNYIVFSVSKMQS